jgi:hypothetical protein
VLALGAAGALMAIVAGGEFAAHGLAGVEMLPAMAGVFALASIAPYCAPMARWVARAAH